MEPRRLEPLLEAIDAVLAQQETVQCLGKHSILEDEGIVKQLQRIVSEHPLSRKDYASYIHLDQTKYTRNLVATGPNNAYALMLLAWGPSHKSTIHDHAGSHCILRVLEGELVESLYSRRDNVLHLCQEAVLAAPQTAYMHDRLGWHRIANASQNAPALSLHLYAPPISTCQTYDEGVSRIRPSASCPYYSINGERVDASPSK